MSGLRGNISQLKDLAFEIRNLPKVVAAKVSAQVAGTITALARRTFDASENAYGDAWELDAQGNRVDLRRTGELASGVRYAATGTRLRAVLAVPYAKYQVGKRPVFPRMGARLPADYVKAISATANAVIRAELGGAT